MEADMLRYERILRAQGFRLIAGVDEAGRGPLAGPVVAACVIPDPDNMPPGADDSKKLSAKKREKLYRDIMDSALSVSVGIVEHGEIDRINILNAAMKAMKLAIDSAEIKPDYIIVDGDHIPPDCGENIQAIIKGDALSASIACASIIAKVTRDRIMCDMAEEYPGYGFEKHKGYGTAEHIQAIRSLGLCPIHRRSFCTKLGAPQGSPVTVRARGDSGEEQAAAYLEGLGYRILERNFKCSSGEIDIIAMDGDTLVFAEVKAASGLKYGSAESHITQQKRKKLRRAAEYYMLTHPCPEQARNDCIAINDGRLSHIKDAF